MQLSLGNATFPDFAEQAAANTAAIEAQTASVDDDTSSLQNMSNAADDTGNAIDQLGTDAGTSNDSLLQLGSGMTALAGSTQLATGKAGGLTAVLEGLAIGGGGALAATTVLAGGIGELVHAGIEGASATQRFNAIIGNMKDKVESVHVGDLNTSLSDLSLKMGTVPSKTENAAASVFQLGINAGLTREQAARTTTQLEALAARSVALKPALGDVSSVMEQMGIRLARGGIFASRLGISLTAADISTRALADTGKATAAQLQPFEKTVAAAELAVAKYGGTLNEVVAKGSQNAEIQQRRLHATVQTVLEDLGRPLVVPFFNLVESALPAVKDFGSVLGEIGTAAFPALITAVQVIMPPLKLFADTIKFLSPALQPLITGLLVYKVASIAAATGSDVYTAALHRLGFATDQTTITQKELTQSQEQVQASSGGVAAGFTRAAAGAAIGYASFQQIGKSSQDTITGLIGMAGSGALVASAFGPEFAPVGAAVGLIVGIGKAMFSGGETAQQYADRINKVASSFEKLRQSKVTQEVAEDFTKLAGLFDRNTALQSYNKTVQDVAEQSPAAAQKIIKSLTDIAAANGKPLSTKQITELNDALKKGEQAYANNAVAAKDASKTNAAVADSAKAVKFSLDDLGSVSDSTTDKIHQSAAGIQNLGGALDDVSSKLPSISSALSDALKNTGAQTPFGIDPSKVGDVTKSLQDVTTATQSFFTNIHTLLGENQGALAQALLQLGPSDLGARAAAQLAANNPLIAAGWNTAMQGMLNAELTAEAHLAQARDRLAFISAGIGDSAVQGFATSQFGQGDLTKLTDTQLAQVANAFVNQQGPLGDAARGYVKAGADTALAEATQFGTSGIAAANNYRAGLASPEAQAAANLAAAQLTDAARDGAIAKAGEFVSVGRSVVNSLTLGIQQQAGTLTAAGRQLGQQVETAFKSQLGFGSPSKVMMQYGRWITEGIAIGMTDALPTLTASTSAVSDTITGNIPGFGASTSTLPVPALVGASTAPTIIINGHVYGDSHLHQVFSDALSAHDDEVDRGGRAGKRV